MTEWPALREKKLSPAEKLAKTAKRVIEPFTKLPIYEPRALFSSFK